jgi:7-cyano-7-deazaguanine synthase
MKSERALVVFSGGQDSTTCLAQALRDYGEGNVSCITFHYGQRHSRDVDVAKGIAAHFGVADHKIIGLDWYNQITDNALLNPEIAIAKAADASCPNTVVDGRNMMFLLIAAVYAKSQASATSSRGCARPISAAIPTVATCSSNRAT